MTSWLNATGGLRYHLRAWRYRRTLWAPFARSIREWLASWRPPERSIVLVGPSGGYCLDLRFLGRFDEVCAVELDPLARWIFARRARAALPEGRTTVRFDTRDYLSPIEGRFSLDGLRALRQQHPSSAVLFCNILGQLPLLGPTPESEEDLQKDGSFERWLADLPAVMEGRSWASFHDRLSGPVRPRALPEGSVEWAASSALVDELYPLTDDESLALNDHRTSALAVDERRRELLWELVPSVFHLVEAIAVRSADPPPARAR